MVTITNDLRVCDNPCEFIMLIIHTICKDADGDTRDAIYTIQVMPEVGYPLDNCFYMSVIARYFSRGCHASLYPDMCDVIDIQVININLMHPQYVESKSLEVSEVWPRDFILGKPSAFTY